MAVYIVEALKWTDEDELALGRVLQSERPTIAVINRSTGTAAKRLLFYIAQLANGPVSGGGVDIGARAENPATARSLPRCPKAMADPAASSPTERTVSRGRADPEKLTPSWSGTALRRGLEKPGLEDGRIEVGVNLWTRGKADRRRRRVSRIGRGRLELTHCSDAATI